MDLILKALKSLLPGLTDKTYKSIKSMLGLNDAQLVESVEDVDENNSLKSVTMADIAEKLRTIGYKPTLPGLEETTSAKAVNTSPAYEPITEAHPQNEQEDKDSKTVKSVNTAYLARMGGASKPEVLKSIMTDILGNDYIQSVYEQNLAFTKYLRGGAAALDKKETKSLKTQIFPMDSIYESVVSGGLDVRTIKANQMEAQGDLGGYAVPPDRQTEVTTRLPGLTAVRGGGARVITLVNSNSTEIPDYKGNSDQYMGLLRMKRGTETGKPAEQNFEIGFLPLVAYIATMKVPMSMSLVEDASNLVSLLMEDIASTISIGEDTEFLIADGVNKALGILPDGENFHGLNEVVTGAADALTVAGIKALKRGIATQYRSGAVWVGTSRTFGRIENFTAGAGVSNWAFPDLSEEDTLLNHKVFEQESMPEEAAGAYPLIYGDMRGYVIVERLGMTIERFHDSGTGVNMVQYEVRKRVGGRLERPWMFALQKVATGDPFS